MAQDNVQAEDPVKAVEIVPDKVETDPADVLDRAAQVRVPVVDRGKAVEIVQVIDRGIDLGRAVVAEMAEVGVGLVKAEADAGDGIMAADVIGTVDHGGLRQQHLQFSRG